MSAGRSRSGGRSTFTTLSRKNRVFAKIAFGNRLFQVAVRGGENTHIDGDWLRATDPVDLAFLDRAQKFCLKPWVHFTDFVEQQRAAVRFFELADAPGDGAGERPFSWPNSSDSSRFSGIAAQFTATNCCPARLLLLCRWRAISSLPVPDSPVISTDASDGAIFSASVMTADIAGSRWMIVWLSSATASRTAAISSASGGKGMYSLAPALMLSTAASAFVPMPQATTGMLIRSGGEAFHQVADVEFDVDHKQLGAAAGPQGAQCLVHAVDVADFGAARDRDLARGGDVSFQVPYDQKSHNFVPFPDRLSELL